MKTNIKTGLLVLSSLLLLASCGGRRTDDSSKDSEPGKSEPAPSGESESAEKPTAQPNDVVFEYNSDKLYSAMYDLSVDPYNINIAIADLGGELAGVSIGRSEAEDNQFNYKDGLVTIAGSLLSEVASGEKEITLDVTGGRPIKVSTLFCDKVIKTAQEFQAINENLTGIYALGNDIDFTGFGNFEPLGFYFSEEDTRNDYFHGILEGNGYALRNLTCMYSQNPGASDGTNQFDTNKDVYDGLFGFTSEAHRAGDNVGIFQIIGSSGVVRDLVLDNVKVTGRTIVGALAGNIAGHVENVLVKENCVVKMNTHFYDNDCNTGALAGIVGGSGEVKNCVSLASRIAVSNFYQDYSDEYLDKTGNGWDHPATVDPNANWWRFVAVDRDFNGGKEIDSNGSQTNGVYSFVGKCWGSVQNSYAMKFQITPYQSSARDICFGQTHKGELKPGSGATDLGIFTNCDVYSAQDLQLAATFANGLSTDIWNIADGSYPSLVAPQISYRVLN